MTNDLEARLERVQRDKPGRDATTLEYFDRSMVVLRPTEGQVAVLARMARSARMDDWQKVSNMVDILEGLLAEEPDKAWLSDVLLGGSMDLGTYSEEMKDQAPDFSVLGLMRAVIMAFGEPEPSNRAEARAKGKKAVRG